MQSKEDEKTQRANEAIRRKAGQDMGRVREDMAAKEAQRDAERKRRGEWLWASLQRVTSTPGQPGERPSFFL